MCSSESRWYCDAECFAGCARVDIRGFSVRAGEQDSTIVYLVRLNLRYYNTNPKNKCKIVGKQNQRTRKKKITEIMWLRKVLVIWWYVLTKTRVKWQNMLTSDVPDSCDDWLIDKFIQTFFLIHKQFKAVPSFSMKLFLLFLLMLVLLWVATIVLDSKIGLCASCTDILFSHAHKKRKETVSTQPRCRFFTSTCHRRHSDNIYVIYF